VKVVVAGALANKPRNGGEAWVRLTWVLGLAALGFDVTFVEEISAEAETREAVTWFEETVGAFGLSGDAVLIRPDGSVVSGPEGFEVREALSEATLLVNISGTLRAPELAALPRRRAYVDLDPGYTQIWDAQGLLGDVLDRHEHLLTVGLAVGGPGSLVPTGGRSWRPVVPPALLDRWPGDVPVDDGAAVTTVASWRGGVGRAELDGRLLGQKAHQFRRFAEVPRHTGHRFLAALDIHPGDAADRELLRAGGWELADPRAVAGTPDAYAAFVRASSAEFSPAQGIYVETRAGWFSDRTAGYLASGRPALVQDTGLPDELRTGEGLVVFSDLDGAVAALAIVTRDLDRHRVAARRFAEEHLDAHRVLGDLMGALLP
jgi:hypothetical protein